MKYRIKEEDGWFYPQSRWCMIWRWSDMGAWSGCHFKYSFKEMDSAKQVIDIDIARSARAKKVKEEIKYHRYP